jgi:glycosyltransferase involved in cell wall biosynthesis
MIKDFKNKNTKQKHFVSFVIGYFPALHKFAPYQNYYLYPNILADEIGYQSIIVVKEGERDLLHDPNLPKTVQVIEYKNFLHFIFLLTKYSLLRSVFYINNHRPESYFAIIFTKLFLCKNIFMGHIQPKRTSSFRQKVFEIVLLFTSRVRLNNTSEQKFLIERGIKKDKIYIVPIAVDGTKFYKTNTDYSKRKDIFYYGNTTTQKGIPTIMESLLEVKKHLPSTVLHIVGSRGDYNPEIDIKRLGLEEYVVLHGTFGHGERLNDILNQFLVFVIDTKAEGQCLAVYESALSGAALCLPNIMSFTEVFRDKALFHDLGDLKGLANNIVTYLTDTKRVESDNIKASNMIKSEYNQEAVKKLFIELITF